MLKSCVDPFAAYAYDYRICPLKYFLVVVLFMLYNNKKNRKGWAMLQMNDHMCTGVMFTNERFLYRKGLVVNVF